MVRRIQPGDVILALPSTGLHTNGYSLARRVLAAVDWDEILPELGCSIGDALLAVHRCLSCSLYDSCGLLGVDIRGMAHITGGGVIDNLPRILPNGVGAVIRRGGWAEPPIFDLIQRLGSIPDDEMFHVFNMGLGLLLILSPDQATEAQTVLQDAQIVGEIVAGDCNVTIEKR